MRHHTRDPAKRAGHIASHLERQHERELAEKGQSPYRDWPSFWLEQYYLIQKELVEGELQAIEHPDIGESDARGM